MNVTVIVFTGAPPWAVVRLVARIRAEAPEVEVGGILYERRLPKAFGRRVREFWRNAGDPVFREYVAARVRDRLVRIAVAVGDALLRFAHASSQQPNGPLKYSVADLRDRCIEWSIPFFLTDDLHSAAALDFARRHHSDLGVVYGTRILKPALYEIPTHGSINIHKRKVPEYRGSGAIGLWELLEDRGEIGVTVHRVTAAVDEGAVIASATIPIHRFDSLASLEIKADAVGNELLIASVKAIAGGTVRDTPQSGKGRTFKTPSPQRMHQLQKRLTALRPPYRATRGRPTHKLLARSLVFAPYVIARNWIRRWRASFPVIILYHHVVTDRPHRDGIPTEAFADLVMYLRKHYRIAAMREAIEMLKKGAVEQPTVVLTFDDGYADNFLGLRAVIEEAAVPATLFISTQIVEEGRLFAHDISSNQSDFLPLTPDQVLRLRRCGCEIGSHTRTHFDCASSDAAALDREIVGSKGDLEKWLNEPIGYFSFPWGRTGRMSPAAVKLARTTYPFVFSAFGGQNFANANGAPWHLRRCVLPNDLWELELQLQAILEFEDSETDVDGQQAALEPA